MSRRPGRDRAVSRYELEQYGAVTKLTVTSRIDLDSWGQRLLWPLTWLITDWAVKRVLKNVKDAAEGV